MNITKDIWIKVAGLVEATYVNIVNKKKAPDGMSLDELKSICYLECGYLINNYRPGPWKLTTYIWEYLEKRAVARAYRELEEAKRMQDMLLREMAAQKADSEEDEVSHEYGDYMFPDRKTLTQHLEDRSDIELVYGIAEKNGLSKVAKLLPFMTEREIAGILDIPQAKVHRQIEKLRELCNRQLEHEEN